MNSKKNSRFKRPPRLAAAALALAVAGSLLLTACSGSANSADAQGPTSVTVAMKSFANDMSLSWKTAGADISVYDHMYDTLVKRAQDSYEIQPDLAESWKLSDDQLTYTFNLRKNVPFHKGNGNLTSADVKFTMEQWMKPESTGSLAQQIKPIVASVDAPDDSTVVVKLSKPYFAFLELLSQQAWIVSKQYVEKVGEAEAAKNPIGTGPYQFDSRTAGSEIVFTKVPGHFLKDGGFDTLRLRAIPDESTQLAAMQSGEVDVMQVSGDNASTLKSQQGITIRENKGAQMLWVTLPGLSNPTTKDYHPEYPWVGNASDPNSLENAKKVRQALALAIDKQSIIDNIFGGLGSLDSFGYYVAPGMAGYSTDWKPLAYDPTKAKALLAEAGYPNGFTIPLTNIGQTSDTAGITQAIAQNWKSIGINVTLGQKDFTAVIGDISSKIKDSYAFVYAVPGGLSQSTIVGMSSNNTFRFVVNSEAYDSKLRQIASQADAATRGPLVKNLMDDLIGNQYSPQIAVRSASFATSAKVAGWSFSNGNGSLHNLQYLEPAGK